MLHELSKDITGTAEEASVPAVAAVQPTLWSWLDGCLDSQVVDVRFTDFIAILLNCYSNFFEVEIGAYLKLL